MEKYFFPLFFILFLVACSSPQHSCSSTSTQGFTHIFNGKDFSQWDNREGHWSIEEGAIVSGNLEVVIENMSWLYTLQSFKDFELHLDAKIIGDNHRNSGIWYRATPFLFSGHNEEKDETIDEHENEGADEAEDDWHPFMAPAAYEYDMFVIDSREEVEEGDFEMANYWASVGDYFTRPDYRHLADQEKVEKVFKSQDWNHIVIRCQGNHLQHWLNGELVLDHIDTSPKRHTEGKIGLQIHDQTKMKAFFKNINIKEL